MKNDLHYLDDVEVIAGSYVGKVGKVIARRATVGRDWYCVKPEEGYCFICHDYEIKKIETKLSDVAL